MRTTMFPARLVSTVFLVLLPLAWAGGAMAADLFQDDSPPPIIYDPDITITAHTIPLNPFQRKLDGTWQAHMVASDGKVYFGTSSHAPDAGGMLLQYDPNTGQVRPIISDLSVACGEDANVYRPQGKLHSDITENDGYLFFSSYYGYTGKTYLGGHMLRYQMGSLEAGAPWVQDFGIPNAGAPIYTATTVDPIFDKVYVNSGGRVYRYNADGTDKTDLGSVGGTWGTCFYHYTDSAGNLWTTSASYVGRVYKVTLAGALTYTIGALPQVRHPVTDEISTDQSGRWFHWGGRVDADRFLFMMRQDGNLYEFDAAIARGGDVAGAVRKIAHVGLAGLDMCYGHGKVYWLRSATPYGTSFYNVRNARTESFTSDAVAADHHLMSLDITDPNAQVVDRGRLIDEQGRTIYRGEGMSCDGRNVYITGDWRVWKDPNAPGNFLHIVDPVEYSTRRWCPDLNSYLEDFWRGQMFAIVPVGPVNAAPAVAAGADQSISLPATASLDAAVTDDGLPDPPADCTYAWSVTSGPAAVLFGDASAVDTTATFLSSGTYVLRLTASDSDLTAHDELTVTVARDLRADFTGDGAVDGQDFLRWQANFNQWPGGGADKADGDANGDGKVDGLDFLIWQAGFNR